MASARFRSCVVLEELGGKDLSQHLGPSGDCGLRQVLFDCRKIGRAGFFNSQKSLEIAEVTINAYDASIKLCHHPRLIRSAVIALLFNGLLIIRSQRFGPRAGIERARWRLPR